MKKKKINKLEGCGKVFAISTKFILKKKCNLFLKITLKKIIINKSAHFELFTLSEFYSGQNSYILNNIL